MNFVLPSHYGNTESAASGGTQFTPKQQLASQGINVIGQGLQSFFNMRTAQAQGQSLPSGGGGYYQPTTTPEPTNYTPLILTSVTLLTIAVVGTYLYVNRGKK